ncbi:hypothetical protein MKX03_023954, partial [Papaver bracteatum]
MKVAHEKPLPFGGVGVIRKNINVRSTTSSAPKLMARKNTKNVPFIPPVDGKIVKAQKITDLEDSAARLGKKQRFLENGDTHDNNEEEADKQTTARITLKDKQSGNTNEETK